MIVTQKHLSRRTVLRGLGATLALPLLDGMVPAFAQIRNSAARPVRRLAAVYVPNGMNIWKWTPAAEGRNFELGPILELAGAVSRQTARADRDVQPAGGSGGGRSRGRPSAGPGLVADRRAREEDRRAPTFARARRWTRSRRRISARKRSSHRWSWRSKLPSSRAAATAAIAAPTPARSPTRRRRRRCRWKSTRARCSSGSSVPPTARIPRRG